MLLVIGLDGFTQGKDWFISLSSSYTFNGPATQVKQKMKQQFFNSYEVGIFFDHDNPIKRSFPNLMARGGKRMGPKTMVFALAGLADQGWVRGYSESASFSAGYESHPRFDYKLYQFGAGMLYCPGRIMAGVAPTLFLLDYRFRGENYKRSLTPAINLSLQVPMNKAGKKFGIDLLLNANYGTPMKTSRNSNGIELFQAGTIDMINGSLGLAFTLR